MSDEVTMFVVPESGRRVIDPDTRQALPADGADVPRSTYWLRRLREGDVNASARPRARAVVTPSNKTEK